MKTVKTDAEWKAALSPEAYQVTRKHGTERAFSHPYNAEKRHGMFHCVCCGEALFGSDAKFDSGTGWPSYFQPLSPEAVVEHRDVSHGMVRTEVRCGKCGSHLGHVFPDGPPEQGGLRYCINSSALVFTPDTD